MLRALQVPVVAAVLISPLAVDDGPQPAEDAAAAVSVQIVDRAADAGLYEVNKSWSAKPLDYDGDGDEDLWIGYHQWGGKLWSNNGSGSFTRVAQSAWPRVNADGKIPDRHDCAWADVDRNDLPDAYCTAGRNLSNVVKYGMDNELWLQLSPGQFSEVGTEWGVGDLCGRGRFATFLDANGDPYPDLFLGNSTERNVSDPCDNPDNRLPDEDSKLFVNQGGAGFEYRRDLLLPAAASGERCAEAFDFNGDGTEDLLTCRFRAWTPRLYRNNANGGFSEVSGSVGLTKAIGDAVPVDLDADGDLDLVTSSSSDFGYQLNLGGRFAPSVTIARVPSGAQGRSVAAGDVDGDGDVDVYALMSNIDNQTNPNDVLLLNDGDLSFTSMAVPPAGGTGDEVIAVHPYGTGVAEFLVLNGYNATVGPVQLIAVETGTSPNVPPTASFTVDCSGLGCHFDASASDDPDGSIVQYRWGFGDGTFGSGATVDHTYASEGSYNATLTVTDDEGATDGVVVTVSPSAVDSDIAFRGANAVGGAASRAPSVTIPTAVRAGDAMLLFVTNGLSLVPTQPEGWTHLGTVADAELRTDVYWQVASATSAGSSLQVTFRNSSGALAGGPNTLTVVAYSGVGRPPVSVYASAVEPSASYVSTHTTPGITVPTAGSRVISYWADRTSDSASQDVTSDWAAPAGQVVRAEAYNIATVGRVTSLLTDDGEAAGAGPRTGLTATANGQTRKATLWTIVLRPS